MKSFFLFIQFIDLSPVAFGFLGEAQFTLSKKGRYKLVDNQYELIKHHTARGATYWVCTQRIKLNCKGKCYTKPFNGRQMVKHIAEHNHWNQN